MEIKCLLDVYVTVSFYATLMNDPLINQPGFGEYETKPHLFAFWSCDQRENALNFGFSTVTWYVPLWNKTSIYSLLMRAGCNLDISLQK